MTAEPLELELTPTDFFEGVAEMRAYLDRNSSQSGRELLTRMAFDLTKARSFDALCQWFCETIVLALAGRGAALLLIAGASYVAHFTCGSLEKTPRAVGDAPRGGTLMPLIGARDAFGALWLEHDRPIDVSLAPLLTAVIDAVAVSLECLRERTVLA
jgi:hypothetical protein